MRGWIPAPPAPTRLLPVFPIGFAHRGARAERRENTLEAFTLALQVGSRGLESDAWLTADGQVVLDHDGVTGPLWRRRRIAAQPREALPSHIPSLVELYRAVGADFELSLDVKDPAAFEPILSAADEAAARDRLWLCHGDRRLLAGWRSRAGAARLVESTAVARLGGGFEAGVAAAAGGGYRCPQPAPSGMDARASGGGARRRVGRLRLGRPDPRRDRSLLDAGIDGVYSDHAGLLAASSRPGRDRPAGRRQATGDASEPTEARQRPDPYEGAADEELLRNRPDDPGVGRVAPVVAHHEVFAFRDLDRPEVGREVTLRQPRLVELVPVDVDVPVWAEMSPREADDPLDEVGDAGVLSSGGFLNTTMSPR